MRQVFGIYDQGYGQGQGSGSELGKTRRGGKATNIGQIQKGNLAWYEKVGGGRSGGGGDGGGDGVRVEGVGRLVRPPGQGVEGPRKGSVGARRAGRTKGRGSWLWS